MNTLALYALGQSPWLDLLSRDLLRSGEIKRLIEQEGLTGITSNPTIFEKAIRGSREYDEQIRCLIASGRSDMEVYEELVLSDIREAADLLRPVYERTGGRDGFVSLEPPAQYADDLEATLGEVPRLFSRAGRENVMIKLPGTPVGVKALPGFIAQGININVTLIFSPTNYEEVAWAYIAGLEERARRGGEMGWAASVASVFVSRVDTAVDRELEARLQGERDTRKRRELEALLGQAAIANSRIIYQGYRQVFASAESRALERRGARKQRLLWGSTGTKNPAYSDVKYVDNLIGVDTVNTLPLETWRAFQDHGVVRLTAGEGLEEARRVVGLLSALGIDIEQVCQRLQREGVEAFARSLELLLASLAEKRRELLKV